MPKKVLFLMSDTGGGHRAAAEAIQAAMEMLYEDTYQFELVDVFRYYTPFPFRYMPEFYPIWVNYSSFTWKLGYLFLDGRLRSDIMLDFWHISWRQGLQALFREHEADVVVCVHSLFNRAALRSLNHASRFRPPFVTVVTDLVSTPVAWYQLDEDLCLLPTQQAYDRGLKLGMRHDQMKVTGLPIHPSFVDGITSKAEAREMLGWHPELPGVLLVSGGDAMGPVYRTACAINDLKLDIQLAIIAGRNQRLQGRLEATHWNQLTHIYPFVDYMARLMTAADILVTKSGPATISEACVAGLPMILSGKVPGQEDGNVELVVENGAGVYAPAPDLVAQHLKEWVTGPPETLQTYASAATALGRPRAAWLVAEEIHRITQNPPERVNQPILPSWSRLFPFIRPRNAGRPETPIG